MELHIWVLYSIKPDSVCEGEMPKGLSEPQKTTDINWSNVDLGIPEFILIVHFCCCKTTGSGYFLF